MRYIQALSDDDASDVDVRASRFFGRGPPASPLFLNRSNKMGVSNASSSSERFSDTDRTALPAFNQFAYKPKSRLVLQQSRRPIELKKDSKEADTQQGVQQANNKRRQRRIQLSDSEDDDSDSLPLKRPRNLKDCPLSASRREFLPVEEVSQCMDDEALARRLQDEEYETLEANVQTLSESEEEEELNPITITLQKCDQIAATLREELHASGSSDCAVTEERYAEVDVTAAKIVSQADVCAACGIAEDDVQRMLKPYQLVGVNFMLLLHRKNVGGAILADEMGLGKTVQAVAFLALLQHLDGDPGPHLLVAPASLLENWQRELKKWCPAFSVELYHGPGRAALSRKLHYVAKTKGPAPFNVMLTCYSLFERQSAQTKDDRKFLKKWDWTCVLMDEAHLLKDRSSFRSRKLRDIAHKAKQRLMLTGTPLQNDLQELWSLLEFMMPDVFDTSGVDLEQFLGTRNGTTGVVTQDKDLMTRIKGILGPFVLRRLKTDVMRQLVCKIQEVDRVEMLEDQAEVYKKAVDEYRTLAEAARAAKASKKASTSLSLVDALPRRQVTHIFTQLRKLANHPLLVRCLYTDETVKRLAKKFHPLGVFGYECNLERVEEELSSYSDFSIHKLCITYGGVPGGQGKLSDQHALMSAKCQALTRLLPKLQQGGHRPLIFSQWTNVLDILEWALDVIGFRYTRLDGSTQVSQRQNLVDEFNNDPNIFAFLLSTRAGGQGLNLTGADTVIIHDVDFNPQMDRQAEDRCHRIGQSKPVTVYRLVTKGTVDESIFHIAQQKLVLDAAVLEGGDSSSDHNEGDARTMGEILSALLAVPPPQKPSMLKSQEFICLWYIFIVFPGSWLHATSTSSVYGFCPAMTTSSCS